MQFRIAGTRSRQISPDFINFQRVADVLADDTSIKLTNTVYDELDKEDFYKSLYLLAFRTYEGFDKF